MICVHSDDGHSDSWLGDAPGGETCDFEFEATAPVELTLEAVQPNDTRRVEQTLVVTDPPRWRSRPGSADESRG